MWLHLSDVASCYTQGYFTHDSTETRAPQPYVVLLPQGSPWKC